MAPPKGNIGYEVLKDFASLFHSGPFANPRVILRVVNRLKLLLHDDARVVDLGGRIRRDMHRLLGGENVELVGIEHQRAPVP